MNIYTYIHTYIYTYTYRYTYIYIYTPHLLTSLHDILKCGKMKPVRKCMKHIIGISNNNFSTHTHTKNMAIHVAISAEASYCHPARNQQIIPMR